MEVDYDIDCESDHYTRVKIVCVFLMIFWSILLPVCLLWSMYKVRLLIPDDKDAALLDDIKALKAAEAALTKGENPGTLADRLKTDAEAKGQTSTPEPEPDKNPAKDAAKDADKDADKIQEKSAEAQRLRESIKRRHQDLVKRLKEQFKENARSINGSIKALADFIAMNPDIDDLESFKRLHEDLVKRLKKQVKENASKQRKEKEAFDWWSCLFTNSPLPQSWQTNVESAKEKEVVDRIIIASLRWEDAKAVLAEPKPQQQIQETPEAKKEEAKKKEAKKEAKKLRRRTFGCLTRASWLGEKLPGCFTRGWVQSCRLEKVRTITQQS
jgi:hypothetical protein